MVTHGPEPWSNRGVEAARPLASPLGRISISNDAVAHIVGRVAAEAYGVVGMASRAKGVGRLLTRDRWRQGITVGGSADEGVTIELNVIVEYGLNLAEVASTVRNRVRYEVERLTGLRVSSVEVRIQDVKRSA
ncbi:MAG: Asp23/Gls24 family envelope stress response protein [Actinobacteria bacterium]|nr:MAG: Asp23/Gls24 family envelope stress response protein [Actinomycetota bacterium]